MGLAERKQKQKIGNDPRNLAWSQDQNRFSYQHLTKFGWNPSRGLGSDASGNPNHIVVAKKLDAGGIGVERAMKEGGQVGGAGEGLDALLKRLKRADGEVTKPMVFGSDDEESEKEDEPEASGSKTVVPIVAPQPLRIMASRAKYQKAKRLAASSPAAMAEILGVPLSSLPASPSPLGSPAASPAPGSSNIKIEITQTEVPAGTSTPTPMGLGFRPPNAVESSGGTPTLSSEDRNAESMLKTSNLSLGEYFRQRMLQRRLEREGKIQPGEELTKEVLEMNRVVNSAVPKEFEGKKVVFEEDKEEEEAGPSGLGLGSLNPTSQASSPGHVDVPEISKKSLKKEKTDKKRKRSPDSIDDVEAAKEVEDMIPLASGSGSGAEEGEEVKIAKKVKKEKKGKKDKGKAVEAAVEPEEGAAPVEVLERKKAKIPKSEKKAESIARKEAKKAANLAKSAELPESSTVSRWSPSGPADEIVTLDTSIQPRIGDTVLPGKETKAQKKTRTKGEKASQSKGRKEKVKKVKEAGEKDKMKEKKKAA